MLVIRANAIAAANEEYNENASGKTIYKADYNAIDNSDITTTSNANDDTNTRTRSQRDAATTSNATDQNADAAKADNTTNISRITIRIRKY